MSTSSLSRSFPWSYIPFVAVLVLTCGPRPAAASTVYLKNTNQKPIVGAIDEAASDEAFLVVKTATVVVKVPRGKIDRVEQQDAIEPAAAPAAPAENSELQQAESALAGDPTNEALRKKVEELRTTVQKRALLNYTNFYNEIDVLLQAKNFKEAVAKADAIVAKVSDEGARTQFKQLKAKAHIELARQFHDSINYPQEEANYVEAMKADPNNPLAPLELGNLLQASMTRKAEAARLYETGIRLAEKHPGIVDNNTLLAYEYKMAEIYGNDLKQYVNAGDTYLSVMLKDPTFQHPQAVDMALQSYANIPLADMADTTRSHIIANTRTILQKKPTKGRAYLLLGNIFFDQKQWAAARDNFEKADKNAEAGTDPLTTLDALFKLATAQRKLGQNVEAATVLQRLLGLKSDHYDALCELAEILMAGANYANAQKLYEQAINFEADKTRAHLGLGTSLQRQGKFQEARESLQKVLDRDDKNATAQLAIAKVYYDEKKYDESITQAEKAITLIRDRYKEDDKTSATATSATPDGATQPVPANSVAALVAALPAAGTLPAAANPATTPTAASAPTSATLAAAGSTTATLAAAASTTGTLMAAAPTSGTQAAAAAPSSAGTDADNAELLKKVTAEEKALLAEANTLIGKAYTLTQKTNQARDNFNAALLFEPNYAPAYEGLGMSFAEDKLDTQAVENFQKAIALDSANPDYYLSFAIYWHRNRKSPDQALPLYLKYQELGGLSPQVGAWITECGGKPKK